MRTVLSEQCLCQRLASDCSEPNCHLKPPLLLLVGFWWREHYAASQARRPSLRFDCICSLRTSKGCGHARTLPAAVHLRTMAERLVSYSKIQGSFVIPLQPNIAFWSFCIANSVARCFMVAADCHCQTTVGGSFSLSNPTSKGYPKDKRLVLSTREPTTNLQYSGLQGPRNCILMRPIGSSPPMRMRLRVRRDGMFLLSIH